MSRYSWRKNPEYDGLARYIPSCTLRFRGEDLAVAQQVERGEDLWFWYGGGVNTAGSPKPLDVVKTQAIAYFKAREAK